MTVSFTGYRTAKMPRPVEQTELNVKNALIRLLSALYNDGYRTFLSGMADGFDMWAAEVVLKLRSEMPEMRLVAVVPFRGQADKFSVTLRARYDAILAQADEVITLAESYSDGVYFRRNDYLVNHASLIVAYYDGKPGGTQYTVNRAREQNKDIIIVNC